LYGAFSALSEEAIKNLWKRRNVVFGERLPRAIYVNNVEQPSCDVASAESDAGSADEAEDDYDAMSTSPVSVGKKKKKRILKYDVEKEMTRLLRRRNCYKNVTDQEMQKEIDYRYGNTLLAMKMYFLGFKKVDRTLKQKFTYGKLREVFCFEAYLCHFYYAGLGDAEIWPNDQITGKRGNFVDPSKDEGEVLRVLPLHFCKKHWGATFMADQMINNFVKKLKPDTPSVSTLFFISF
jgi:hypothetical protein